MFDYYNWVQVLSYLANLMVVILHSYDFDGEDSMLLTHLASFLVLILWLMIFYWMRLFPTISFYIMMIIETGKRISFFIILFVLMVATFANAMLVIDRKHK